MKTDRDAAIEQAIQSAYEANNNTWQDEFDAYKDGFRAGAASVSRKEVVEEAFARVKEILPSISLGDFEEDDYPKAMDAVLTEMEKSQ